MDIQEFNSLDNNTAVSELLKVCGSTLWANNMSASRPFSSLSDMMERAEIEWSSVSPDDWKEAFAAHPKYVKPFIR